MMLQFQRRIANDRENISFLGFSTHADLYRLYGICSDVVRSIEKRLVGMSTEDVEWELLEKRIRHDKEYRERKDLARQEEVVYYFLENYDLRQVEIESVIDVDGRTEITFKLINTDEGGNPEEE